MAGWVLGYKMRINTDNVWMFYDPKTVRVFLNGELQDKCIAADDEKGYIVKYVEPISTDAEDNLITETLYGKVDIQGSWYNRE